MKFRYDLVSNSSSTSYIAVLDKDKYDSILNSFKEYVTNPSFAHLFKPLDKVIINKGEDTQMSLVLFKYKGNEDGVQVNGNCTDYVEDIDNDEVNSLVYKIVSTLQDYAILEDYCDE